MNAVDMLDKIQITSDVYFNALSYLMFLKKNRKRKGAVKTRGCANSRPQYKFISKEEPTSLTVSTYALFISCAIDAMERKQVVTCNIPRVFYKSTGLKITIVIKIRRTNDTYYF